MLRERRPGILIAAVASVLICAAWLTVGQMTRRSGPEVPKGPEVIARRAPVSGIQKTLQAQGADAGFAPSKAPSDEQAATQADPRAARDAEPGPKSVSAPGGPVDYGKISPIPKDANPQVAGVVEAFQTGEHPERKGLYQKAPPFSEVDYRRDPAAWCGQVVPGRIWQTGRPGPDVPVLVPLGASAFHITQGESVVLRCRTTPGAPCTYQATDLGYFDNRLTTITVQADERGLAATTFHTGPGVLNRANVIAASPLASGFARFTVMVESAVADPGPARSTDTREPSATSSPVSPRS